MRRDVLREAHRSRSHAKTSDDDRPTPAMLLRMRREPTLVVSAERRVLLANAAAEALLGRPADQLLDTPYALPLESGPVTRVAIPRNGHAARLAEMHVVSIPWDGERASVVTFTDITEQRQLEQALRESQAERTAGRLAAGVAHDFNNLLQSILGCCTALECDAGDATRVRQLAGQIAGVVRRAEPLVRRLLAHSQQRSLAVQDVDLAATVADMAVFLRRLIGTDVDVQVVPATTPLWVRIDPTQLEQVILNLALNARDALAPGGAITIAVRAVRSEPNGAAPAALLLVEDNGCGMTAETRARIFEPFFSTKAPGKGTGLGLSTVREIVASAGGRIDVESRSGAGTRFEIRLPLAVPRKPRRVVPERPRAETKRHGGILIVDDDAEIREVLHERLCEAGYVVATAGSAREARARIRARDTQIDVLIADVSLPGGGAALARAVRHQYPRVRVIFMSGHCESDVRAKGAGEASAPFLHKPFAVEELLELIRSELSTQGRTVFRVTSDGVAARAAQA